MLKSILSNSLFLLIGNIIGRFTLFLTNIIVARFLTQDEFGQFSMIRNTVSLLEGLLSGSMGSLMIKRVAEYKENKSKIIKILFIINMLFTLILSIILYISIPYIINSFLLGIQALYIPFIISIILLISTSFSIFVQNVLIGLENYKDIAKASFLSTIISIPFVFLFIDNLGLNGALFAVVFYFSVDFFTKLYYINKYFEKNTSITPRDIFIELKKLLNSSSYLFLSFIISGFTFWYARTIIINDNGFSDLAIFDAAFQWLTIIMIITGATTSIILPRLSKISIGDNTYNKTLIYNISINFIISILFAFVFIYFSKNIMSIYGENYILGSGVLKVLAITSIFFTLASVFNKIFIVKNRVKEILFLVTISSFLMLVVLKSGVFVGALGLAYSFMSFYFFSMFIYFILFFIKKNDV